MSNYATECVHYGQTLRDCGTKALSGRNYDFNDITGYFAMGPTGQDRTFTIGQQQDRGGPGMPPR